MSLMGITTYGDIKASTFVWDSLWRSEQNSFVKFNTLDAVQVGAGEIVRWLFTSTEGFVKSKSKARWNKSAIMERSTGDDPEGHFRANLSISIENLDWKAVVRNEDLDNGFRKDGYSTAMLILYGHIEGSVSYLEATYEVSPGVLAPKLTTFSLCGSKASGSVSADIKRSFPSTRIKCLNKTTNTASKKVLTELVHIIESRRNIEVRKITAIFMLETDSSFDSSDEKILWLHHVQNFAFTPKKPRASISCDSSIGAEGRSDSRRKSTIEVRRNTGSIHRVAKCVGDFCHYSDKEEAKLFDSLGEDYSDVITEGKRALRRHRQPLEVTNELFDSELDHETSASFSNTASDEFENGTIAYDSEVGATSQSQCIPYKSLLLSRQDMLDLGVSQECSSGHPVQKLWPLRLQHWWWRVGRSMAPRRPDSGPEELMVGSMAESSRGSRRPSRTYGTHSNTNGSRRKQSTAGSDEDTLADQTLTSNASHILYDLNENSYGGENKRSVGKLSWYYSDANVCEACYSVYRDIDDRRKKHQKYLHANSSPMKSSPTRAEKEQEEKIHSQRQFSLKMSKSQDDRSRDDKTTSNRRNSLNSVNSEDYNVGSIIPLPRIPKKSSTKKKVIGLVPGTLPPLGQLKDVDKKQKYQQVGSSFIRNIGSKVQILVSSQLSGKSSSNAVSRGASETTQLDDTANEWEQMTCGGLRTMSEGRAGVRRGRKGSKPSSRANTVDAKDYDASRLLHKHQRELSDMRAALRTATEYVSTDSEEGKKATSRSKSSSIRIKGEKSSAPHDASRHSTKTDAVQSLPPLNDQHKPQLESLSSKSNNYLVNRTPRTPRVDDEQTVSENISGKHSSGISTPASDEPFSDMVRIMSNLTLNELDEKYLEKKLSDMSSEPKMVDSPPFRILDSEPVSLTNTAPVTSKSTPKTTPKSRNSSSAHVLDYSVDFHSSASVSDDSHYNDVEEDWCPLII